MAEENVWPEVGGPGERSLLYGEAQAPGSCGELVQGSLGGVDFLVSCPINLFSRAQVWLRPAAAHKPRRHDINIYWLTPRPLGRGHKVSLVLRRLLAHLQAPVDSAWIRLESSIPTAKGMGSSTADMVAAITAAAMALDEVLTPLDKARLAIEVEPSDSIMFPNLARLDHRRGNSVRLMGPPPPMQVTVIDMGGEVDTQDFNRRPDLDAANAAKEGQLRQALVCLREGIKLGDPARVGQAATISARAHQAILPKPGLEDLIASAETVGAAGVCVAHSGTVAGVLTPAASQSMEDLCPLPPDLHPQWSSLGTYQVIAGGTRRARGGMTFGRTMATAGIIGHKR